MRIDRCKDIERAINRGKQGKDVERERQIGRQKGRDRWEVRRGETIERKELRQRKREREKRGRNKGEEERRRDSQEGDEDGEAKGVRR